MRTIILTGGGTAGHIYGNIALLPKLQTFFDNIIYVGSENGMEREILASYKQVKYIPIKTIKFTRKFTLKNLAIPFILHQAIKQCKKIVDQEKPSVIFSKGGYVSVPIVLAGHKKHIPIIAHESDLSLGLANRVIKNKVQCICTTFPQTAQSLKNGVWVGSPIRENLFKGDKNFIKNKFQIPPNTPILLVVGGSLGANLINELVWNNLDYLCSNFFVIHITGRDKAKAIKHKNYAELEYCEKIENILAITDFALTRGGSNTIWEFVALKTPMLIIPLSLKISRGDQEENAKYFEKMGYALTLSEANITQLYFKQKIKELKEQKDFIIKNMNELPKRDTLEIIFKLIKKYSIN